MIRNDELAAINQTCHRDTGWATGASPESRMRPGWCCLPPAAPHFIQQFGQTSWKRATGSSLVELRGTRAGVQLGREMLDGFFRACWNRAAPAGRSFISAMAADGSTPHEVVSRTTFGAGHVRRTALANVCSPKTDSSRMAVSGHVLMVIGGRNPIPADKVVVRFVKPRIELRLLWSLEHHLVTIGGR